MRKWWAIGIFIIVFLIAALAFFLFPRTAADSVTLVEATAAIEEQYGGTVENTSETEEFYQIEFSREDGQYLATVSRADGQVATLELVESAPVQQISEEEASQAALAAESGELDGIEYDQESNSYQVAITSETEQKTLTISAEDGEVLDVQKEPLEPQAEPSESPDAPPPDANEEPERIISQDAAIAIAKETLNGTVDEIEFIQTADGGYYLVEIDHEATEREATIQIHAIRGETMTVEWDD